MERVGVRGGENLHRRRMLLPLTPGPSPGQALTLSPFEEWGEGTWSLVVGGGDELGVFLGAPLEDEEVVIAAAAAGEAAAEGGARVVAGAAALLGVEEAADAAEDLARLAAHGVLAAPALDRELGLGVSEGDPEVLGEPLHIALVEGDQRIGAAVAGAFLAVVHGQTTRTGGRIAGLQSVSTNSCGMQRKARRSPNIDSDEFLGARLNDPRDRPSRGRRVCRREPGSRTC